MPISPAVPRVELNASQLSKVADLMRRVLKYERDDQIVVGRMKQEIEEAAIAIVEIVVGKVVAR